MELIIVILLVFYLLLLENVLKIKKQLDEIGEEIKSINHDLNMVSKTMENMHKHEKAKELSKQILKG
jgi:uncharacterized protein YoxC